MNEYDLSLITDDYLDYCNSELKRNKKMLIWFRVVELILWVILIFVYHYVFGRIIILFSFLLGAFTVLDVYLTEEFRRWNSEIIRIRKENINEKK